MALDMVSASPRLGLEGGILLDRAVEEKNTGSDDNWGLKYQLGNILIVLCQATVFLDLSVCVCEICFAHTELKQS